MHCSIYLNLRTFLHMSVGNLEVSLNYLNISEHGDTKCGPSKWPIMLIVFNHLVVGVNECSAE